MANRASAAITLFFSTVLLSHRAGVGEGPEFQIGNFAALSPV